MTVRSESALNERLTRRNIWKKKRKKAAQPRLSCIRPTTTTLSQETQQRLRAEAYVSPAFEGMTHSDINTEIERLIGQYLDRQPWWFGRTDDSRLRKAERAYKISRGLIVPNEQPAHLARRHKSIDELIAMDEAEAPAVEA
jgi:hypothetical protein